uniref:Ig-like domain-containing protein n=1 Tax=Leptobrachium leishanense TaxID=445787 RepID=A0A8C5N0V6_9ANUR
MRIFEAALCVLCGLAILLSGNLFLCQEPRFIAARKGRRVSIHCFFESVHDNATVCNTTWYLGTPNGTFIRSVLSDADSQVKVNGRKSCPILVINNIQKRHNGLYFCKFNSKPEQTSPCGTELMVLGYSSMESAKSRNMMKDAIIMIQTILIVLFVVVPVLLLLEMKKKRSVKLEDHTYEGLEIYQSATYEDIQNVAVLTAKSMIGEHPCME